MWIDASQIWLTCAPESEKVITVRGWRSARSSTVSSCGYRLGWMNSCSKSDATREVDHQPRPGGRPARGPTSATVGFGGRPRS